MPLVVAVLTIFLILAGHHALIAGLLVAIWGFAFGGIPVAWSTWVGRAVPDETESAGGLQVAAIQLAIMLGAAVGGGLMDLGGVGTTLLGSGVIMLLSVSVTAFSLRPS
ncbi:hypothetical protein [Xanthomonas citri]|uniref:hypothetical protein n=1 Tax=Xanthomonas citri TaxID=346 RepID=UPI0019009DC9|nr:hypothetical protein [Xanthomonas citri]